MKLKKIKWTWKLGVVLSSVLLVLVGSLVAYYIFVPKLKELEKLSKEIVRVKNEQNKLVLIGVPKRISEGDKKTLAEQVPVNLEQSRFLKSLREEEKASGAVITNIQFNSTIDDSTSEKQSAGSKSNTKAASTNSKKKSVLTSAKGRISLEGNYEEVRSFLEKFSAMSRLVTLNNWRLSATEHVKVTKATTSGGTVLQPTIPTPQPTTIPNPAGQPQVIEEPGPKVTDADLTNEFLKDRTPIFEEKQMLRVLDLIKSQAYETQEQKDMANLEMQHTFNRYMAGLLGMEKANSILDQEYASRFLDGANIDVRKVLGLPPAKRQVVVNQTTPVEPVYQAAPIYLLTRPSQTVQGTKVVTTSVRVEISFTIYYAPEARFFPAPTPLELYEPTERSNPVESY